MSNRPNLAAKADPIYDATALLAEIEAEAKPFTLGDQTFMLPSPTGWSDDVMAAAQANNLPEVGRLILGDEDYERFKSVGGNAAFLQRLVAKLHGTDMGESSASSRS